jgi:hypothetical protein
MWHSISVSGQLRLNDVETSELLTFLRAKNESAWAETRQHFWPGYFVEHFAAETFLTATEVEEAAVWGYLRVIQRLTLTKPKKKKEE